MTDEELEKWTCGRVEDVRWAIEKMSDVQRRVYLLELASYIVSFAADAGATDWPAELHLGDVIDKHIRRSPTLMNASDGYLPGKVMR